MTRFAQKKEKEEAGVGNTMTDMPVPSEAVAEMDLQIVRHHHHLNTDRFQTRTTKEPGGRKQKFSDFTSPLRDGWKCKVQDGRGGGKGVDT